MKGLFGEGCKARNNEEYRLVLVRRKKRQWILFTFSLVLSVTALVLEYIIGVADDADYYVGFVLGLGMGVAAAALGNIYRIKKCLADEVKLKEERLKETDERENEVNSLALKAAAKIMLIVLYILLVAGALFCKELMFLCFGLIIIFILCFALMKRIYDKKL